MIKTVYFAGAALLLAGCASSSGVFAIQGDTYGITTTAITSFGGAGTARASAVRTATDFCNKQGKTMVVQTASTDSQFTQGSSDLKFKCEVAK